MGKIIRHEFLGNRFVVVLLCLSGVGIPWALLHVLEGLVTVDDRGTMDGGAGVGAPAASMPDVREMSDEDLADLVSRLREVVIPPAGTARSSVDLVYGEPRLEPEPPRGGKGPSSDFPMHVYDLLPAGDGAPFRAFLSVTYRNDVVVRAAINHFCVVKGRRAVGRETAAREAELRVEQQGILRDLEAIRARYRVPLEKARWAR